MALKTKKSDADSFGKFIHLLPNNINTVSFVNKTEVSFVQKI